VGYKQPGRKVTGGEDGCADDFLVGEFRSVVLAGAVCASLGREFKRSLVLVKVQR